MPAAKKGSGIRVAKLGGSLLSLPDFPDRIQSRLAAANRRVPLATLMVVGGGELIDAVRSLDRLHSYDASLVHHECIQLLSSTGRLVHSLLPQFGYIASAEDLSSFNLNAARMFNGFAIVDVAMAMPRIATKVALPEDWTTTTDSISAALAIAVDAEELLIFKSADPVTKRADDLPIMPWLEALACDGFVDGALPALASRLPPLRFENLRS